MKLRRPSLIILGIVVIVGGLIAWAGSGHIKQLFLRPADSTVQQSADSQGGNQDVATMAQKLTVPWGVAFLPGGDMLVTERSGTLRRIGQDRQTYTIGGVEHVGEGGLMGLALDPDFGDNNRLYLYLTTREGGGLTNRIERYTLSGNELADRQILLQDIPGERNHDGGRIAFGPDKFLYVTTGDAGMDALAQDRNSLAGKILRITTDGKPAPGNPFGNMVYSYGHRNPQGLAWDGQGRLWSSEHGPSGAGTGYDELNLIRSGANYGWPVIKGDESREGMQRPAAHSGPDETWAPGGLAYYDGSLFFGGLRGQSLYEVKLNSDDTISLLAHFRQQYGRLRTTAVEGDRLYVTTSNTDGRGDPKDGDDKVMSIRLDALMAD